MTREEQRMRNLKPNSQLTPEERRERASKMGKFSGLARAKRKAMRETLIELLSMPMKKGEIKSKIEHISDFKDANVDLQTRILVGIAYKAAKGDVKAAEYIRDTIGEAPVQEMKVEQSAVSGKTDEELMKIIRGDS